MDDHAYGRWKAQAGTSRRRCWQRRVFCYGAHRVVCREERSSPGPQQQRHTSQAGPFCCCVRPRRGLRARLHRALLSRPASAEAGLGTARACPLRRAAGPSRPCGTTRAVRSAGLQALWGGRRAREARASVRRDAPRVAVTSRPGRRSRPASVARRCAVGHDAMGRFVARARAAEKARRGLPAGAARAGCVCRRWGLHTRRSSSAAAAVGVAQAHGC